MIQHLARHRTERQRRELRQLSLLDLLFKTLGDPFVLRDQRVKLGLVRLVLREACLVGKDVKRLQDQKSLIEQLVHRVVLHVHYVGLVVHGLPVGEFDKDRLLVQSFRF